MSEAGTDDQESEHEHENDATPSGSHEHVHGPDCAHDHDHHHSHAPIRRETAKVGRNDPCSCGSGKKFKKCCG